MSLVAYGESGPPISALTNPPADPSVQILAPPTSLDLDPMEMWDPFFEDRSILLIPDDFWASPISTGTLTPTPSSVTLTFPITNLSMLVGTMTNLPYFITNTLTTNLLTRWYVNGIQYGDNVNGTFYKGQYVAPPVIPATNPVTVTAVSQADPTVSASAIITLTNLPPVGLQLSTTNFTMRLGDTHGVSPQVLNRANQSVTWSVNGIPNGNATVGIMNKNSYVAPWVMPTGSEVTLTATTVIDPTVSAQATVHLENPYPAIYSVSPNPIPFGMQTVVITGKGFVPETTVLGVGMKPLSSSYISPTQVVVSGYFPPTMTRFTEFGATNPNPYPTGCARLLVPTLSAGTNLSFFGAARLLEQASWGPDATNVDYLQTVGFDRWWADQISAPPSSYYHDTNYWWDLRGLQVQFVSNALVQPDQLRQRVAWALSQFLVVSGFKNGTGDKFAPYLNVLSQNALGSYAQLLTDLTLTTSMAYYLDMVDNEKGNPSKGRLPNENYAREFMQLFTIGLYKLNPDSSYLVVDGKSGIPTFDPEVIPAVARVFTGWTWPGTPDPITGHSPRNFDGQVQAIEFNHDTDAKVIFNGITLPAGNTARQDLDAMIQAVMNHPNTAPFVSLRLIQNLVKSNPTYNYIRRVSTVFTATRGDLAAVVRAILLDSEARSGDNPVPVSVNGGHLREPVLYSLSILRTCGVPPPPGWLLGRWTSSMGQALFYPPSVFGYYSPGYTTDDKILGPEFQELSQSAALARFNFAQALLYNSLNWGCYVQYSPYIDVSGSPDLLLQSINNTLFYGQMPTSLAGVIQTAILQSKTAADACRNALYLAMTSNFYQVQH